MCTNGSFFALQSEDADKFLLNLRQRLQADLSPETVVLLAVLDGASSHRRQRQTRFVEFFRETCRQAFSDTGAVTPDFEATDYPDSVACAWYPQKTWDIIAAAARIQQNLLHAVNSSRRPAYIAIGRHELAAFRLVRSAGENQVVIDPDLWPGLDIHSPDFTEVDRRLECISASIAEAIPWTIDDPTPNSPPPMRKRRPAESRRSSAMQALARPS